VIRRGLNYGHMWVLSPVIRAAERRQWYREVDRDTARFWRAGWRNVLTPIAGKSVDDEGRMLRT
jgi:hypothetical protein